MKDAFFLWILTVMQISIFLNIQFTRTYITTRKKASYTRFLIITFINFIIGLVMLFFMIRNPDVVTRFRLQSMTVLESGVIFFFLMFTKIRITVMVLARAKNPDYYDISFFGKKVYKPDVVKKSELAIFIITMPFTLITGAYFIANIFI